MVVAEDLHLDVARRREVALQQDLLVAEGGLGLAARGLQRLDEIRLALHLPTPLADAAGGRLGHHRVAHPPRLDPTRLGRMLPPAVTPSLRLPIANQRTG